MRNPKKIGFSLVELIIVIAIVGILSAIAVPMYKTYSMRAKLSAIQTVLESIKARSVQYAARNGGLPDANQLGFATLSGPIAIADPHALNPNIMDLEIVVDGTCGSFSIVMFYADPSILVGISSLAVEMVILYTKDGTLETGFFYRAIDNNGDPIASPDLFPQWQNFYTDNGLTENNFINSASCQ